MGLDEVKADLRAVQKGFRDAGVPANLLQGVSTRALRSARRQTGEFRSNRQSRWTLDERDPQYGTETDCKIINIRLLGILCEFLNGPPERPERRRQYVRDIGQVPETSARTGTVQGCVDKRATRLQHIYR